MKIAIFTTGRFHVLDLARELDALGHEVRFYSCVPPGRAARFGLPRRCARTLWPAVPLFAFLNRGRSNSVRRWMSQAFLRWLDRVAVRFVEPCELFIGMSGIASGAARHAKRSWSSRVWVERGSRHILSQKEILESLPQGRGVPPVTSLEVERELGDYELADVIVVPSRHACDSFIERGTPAGRLFRNCYGVDLSMFPPTRHPPPDQPPTVLMVGTWSYQKGCDLLPKIIDGIPEARLLHAGGMGDAPWPQHPRISTLGLVDQPRLHDVYARAHVAVLASRQEGLALVQPQALACGLRLVCSDRTGGEDLTEILPDPRAVTVVRTGDVPAFRAALANALRAAVEDSGKAARGEVAMTRDWLQTARARLSWRAYGERYAAEIERR